MADPTNPIRYSDLIQPDDSIQQLISQLEELIAKYGEVRSALQGEAAGLAKSMQTVSGATEEQRDVIMQTAKDADALAERMKQLRVEEGAAQKEVDTLKDAQKEYNQILKLQAELARSADGSYKQLSAQYRLNKIELNNMSKAMREGTPEGRKLEAQTKAIYQEMSRLQKATGKYTLEVGHYENALAGVLGVNKNFVAALTDSGKAAETFKGVLGALASPIGATIALTGAAVGAFKLWSSTIHDTQSTGDAFDIAMAQWNRSVDIFRKSISTFDFSGFITGLRESTAAAAELQRVLDDAFEREWSIKIRREQAQPELQQLLEDFRNQTKSIEERQKAGENYLTKAEQFYNEEKGLLKEIEEARLEDLFAATNRIKYKTDAEREAAKESLRNYIIEFNITRDRIDLAKKYINAQDELYAIQHGASAYSTDTKYWAERTTRFRKVVDETSDDIKELAKVVKQYGLTSNKELEAYNNSLFESVRAESAFQTGTMRIRTQLHSLEARTTNVVSSNTRARTSDRDAESEAAKKAAEEQATALQEIQDAEIKAMEARHAAMVKSRMTRLQFERDEINLQIAADGDSLELRLKLIEKERDIELEANRQKAEDIRQNEALINAKYDRMALDEIDKRAKAVVERTKKAVKTGRKEYENIFQVFGLTIGSKDEDEEILKDRERMVIEAVGNIKDSVSSLIDSWRQAAQAAVDAADAQVAAAEKVVESEREAAANGYANSVQKAERELALAKKQREQAQKEAEQAQQAQLALDSVTQASSLVTASANIWKSLSGIPIVGPGLAAAALALMWGSFAAARIRARQVTKESYGEGTVELLEGGSHASGHDIPMGYTKDGKERRAEGGEFFAIINKRNSRKYRDIIPDVINSLNDGSFADRYQRAGTQLKGLAVQMMVQPDLGRLEAGVDAIRRQGEESRMVEGAYTVIRYKNLTRRVKN